MQVQPSIPSRRGFLKASALALAGMNTGCSGRDSKLTEDMRKFAQNTEGLANDAKLGLFLEKIDEAMDELQDDTTPALTLSGLGEFVYEQTAYLPQNLQNQKAKPITNNDIDFITNSPVFIKFNSIKVNDIKKSILAGDNTGAYQQILNLLKEESFHSSTYGFISNDDRTRYNGSCNRRALAVAFLRVILKKPEPKTKQVEGQEARIGKLRAQPHLA